MLFKKCILQEGLCVNWNISQHFHLKQPNNEVLITAATTLMIILMSKGDSV